MLLPSHDTKFQRSISISPGLLDVLFPMTGLVLFLVWPPLITIRRCLGDQVSGCHLSALRTGPGMLWHLRGFRAEDCVS